MNVVVLLELGERIHRSERRDHGQEWKRGGKDSQQQRDPSSPYGAEVACVLRHGSDRIDIAQDEEDSARTQRGMNNENLGGVL